MFTLAHNLAHEHWITALGAKASFYMQKMVRAISGGLSQDLAWFPDLNVPFLWLKSMQRAVHWLNLYIFLRVDECVWWTHKGELLIEFPPKQIQFAGTKTGLRTALASSMWGWLGHSLQNALEKNVNVDTTPMTGALLPHAGIVWPSSLSQVCKIWDLL